MFVSLQAGKVQSFIHQPMSKACYRHIDNVHGLNTYDYGARQHDPILARWDRIDPLAEKYYSTSPYVYCANNPVRFIDPDGRDPGDFFATLDDAAKDFGKYTNPISIRKNREYVTSFYSIKNKDGGIGFSYTQPKKGSKNSVKPCIYISRNKNGNVKTSNKKTNEKATATGHTHGAYDVDIDLGNDIFSGNSELREDDNPDARKEIKDDFSDIGLANKDGMIIYVCTPNGTLQNYDPNTGEIKIVDENMPKDPKDPNSIKSIKDFYGK